MRKWLQELMHVPEDDTVSDRTMTARVCVTVAVTLFCLAMMSFTAYAYFTHDMSSGSNQILTAYFDAVVSVRKTDAAGAPVTVHTDETFTCWADLKGGNTYYVTLRHAVDSTANTGYVIVNETYHTAQIEKDTYGNSLLETFYLTLTEDQRVTFRVCWGTSPYADDAREEGDLYIEEGETVELTAAVEDDTTTETEDSTTTTDSTTTSTTESDSTTLPTEAVPTEPTDVPTTEAEETTTTTDVAEPTQPIEPIAPEEPPVE